MTEQERESGEEQIDEEGRNPTQQKIDEETDPGGEAWEETSDEPHQGEGGQDAV